MDILHPAFWEVQELNPMASINSNASIVTAGFKFFLMITNKLVIKEYRLILLKEGKSEIRITVS